MGTRGLVWPRTASSREGGWTKRVLARAALARPGGRARRPPSPPSLVVLASRDPVSVALTRQAHVCHACLRSVLPPSPLLVVLARW